MSTVTRWLLRAGISLALVGVAVFGFGAALASLNTCESGYAVAVERLEAGEPTDPDARHLAYENLSADETRAFDAMLAAEAPPVYDDTAAIGNIANSTISVDGARYRTSGVFVVDCFDRPGVLTASGGLAAVLGGLIAGLAFVGQRLR